MAGKIQDQDIKSVAELTGAGATAASLPNDDKVWVKANTINKTLNQAITDGDIGGGSGGINYIPFQISKGATITGVATYADTPGAAPVDGTGGSPSSTIAVSTNSSLISTTNLLWTKSAANRQGEGWSVDFSIDAGYQAKPFTLSFLYSIASGTYVDGDMTCWLYDVTNSVLIQPSASSILNIIGSTFQRSEFQTSSNSTSYRLIIHTSSTSALAYSLRFDSISVSPNTYNIGASDTDWVSYTPTFTGFGTPTGVSFRSRRNGSDLLIEGSFVSGTSTAVEARISLPTGLTAASTLPTLSVAGPAMGTDNFSSSFFGFYPTREPSVSYLTMSRQTGAVANLTKGLGNALVGSGNLITVSARVPIQGWGVSQVLSSETATNVVAAKANGAPGSVGSGAVIVLPSLVFDTNGAYNTTTGRYTVPVPGKYKVFGFLNISPANASLIIYKNGISLPDTAGITSSVGQGSFFGMVDCIAGDILDIRANATTGASGGNSYIGFERISGPAQIAASESITAKYTGTNSSAGNTTVANYDTMVWDSHGAVTTGTNAWRFTAPTSGKYSVKAAYGVSSVAWSAGAGVAMYLLKKGSQDSIMTHIRLQNNITTDFFMTGSTEVSLLAGEYIQIQTSGSSTFNMNPSSVTNWITVDRISN